MSTGKSGGFALRQTSGVCIEWHESAGSEWRSIETHSSPLDLRYQDDVDHGEERVADESARSRCPRCSGLRSVSRISSVMPIRPFIGVRISWLIVARRTLLWARVACSAASSAVGAPRSRHAVAHCHIACHANMILCVRPIGDRDHGNEEPSPHPHPFSHIASGSPFITDLVGGRRGSPGPPDGSCPGGYRPTSSCGG